MSATQPDFTESFEFTTFLVESPSCPLVFITNLDEMEGGHTSHSDRWKIVFREWKRNLGQWSDLRIREALQCFFERRE
jgi:hypothetical protein